MWVVILGGLVIYKLLRRFFSDDVVSDVEASDVDVLFSVATRLEKLFGGKSYTGLRIPDPDSGSRQDIDLVLLTKWEALVISVHNYAGVVSVSSDGSWVCFDPGRGREERYPDPVTIAQKKALVLEAYLEQRGVILPEGFLSWKVILPNPKFCTLNASILSSLPPEIITYGQWEQLKPEQKNMLPRWMKGAFCGGKKEIQESVHQQLDFILSTAPMWDRLELRGNKFLLGEFVEFKGNPDDVLALRAIRRSKVNRLLVQKTSMFGLAPRRLQVLYTPRDYRSEGASSSEWKEVTVRSNTEILFRPENSSKVCKFKLSAVTSMALSA
ncbi:hypothetical protein MLD38_033625 [Melastoma candidum]|uniref:Uncharacterized protein n=1 Tax=Melastoma candidum TaxID=119954 RepID=A0ACB9M732_9MYRT|nr:hypothetical protein MLD38_033625 [Melastoma candidum]